jgi:hypothetical protein
MRVTLKDRNAAITILEAYSLFLEKKGYLDTDWRAEAPFAIDEFLKSLPEEPVKDNECPCDEDFCKNHGCQKKSIPVKESEQEKQEMVLAIHTAIQFLNGSSKKTVDEVYSELLKAIEHE